MWIMVKTYAELCLENQRLHEQVKELKKSSRLQLLMEISQENLVLHAENDVQKKWIAYLEARLRYGSRTV